MVWVNRNHQDHPLLQGHPVNLVLGVEPVNRVARTIQVLQAVLRVVLERLANKLCAEPGQDALGTIEAFRPHGDEFASPALPTFLSGLPSCCDSPMYTFRLIIPSTH